MTVQDVLELVKLRTSNIALSKNNTALIRFIYLGVSELYRLFNLSIKSESIPIVPSVAYYELKNPDVAMLLHVYDITGRELRQSDVIDSHAWEYKIVNYRSFILNHTTNGFLYAVYKASPRLLSDFNDTIDLPDAMIEALLTYITYMIQSTITTTASSLGRSTTTEAAQYYQMFKQLCQELEMQGYKIPLNAETASVLIKGYK